MVELACTPFVELIDRMRLEYRHQGSLFDLPAAKWYLPLAADAACDLSVRFHDRIAGNPVGPASGPQTQMAQNLVLSWLAGGRILELKTVQVNDHLKIPRPCIDATNVGYNVEWSQELRVEESLDQYVQGAMLIHMLRHAPTMFGDLWGDVELSGTLGDTVYDMSIGYDLAGIRSEKVRRFMDGMLDASDTIERLRGQLPARLAPLRDLEFPTQLSRSVTLSTFHGCPADEIERICEFLLTEVGVHTIVKMNPPMLGQDRLEHLLYDVLGYHEVRVHPPAYTSGLQFAESVAMSQRLSRLARQAGLCFGAKFCNTLEVINHRNFFPPSERVMYLSGAPLHVITLTLADAYRVAVGADVPISFSAGVDRKNFPLLVACGFTPVTTCTDLLKTGGYGRLPHYLDELEKDMRRVGAGKVADYVLDCFGHREAAAGDAIRAGFLNTPHVVAQTQADPRYTAARNRSVPRRIDSHLVLFDCITCYKCIPVCPNDANFVYECEAMHVTYRDVVVAADQSLREVGAVKEFALERSEQIANFADYCNHCGNCDTFCPEYDGPYVMKPSFFGSYAAFATAADHDGFVLQTDEADSRLVTLLGRIEGQAVSLRKLPDDQGHEFCDGTVCLRIREHGECELMSVKDTSRLPHVVDLGRYYACRALWEGISNPRRIHAVNVPLLAPERLG